MNEALVKIREKKNLLNLNICMVVYVCISKAVHPIQIYCILEQLHLQL